MALRQILFNFITPLLSPNILCRRAATAALVFGLSVVLLPRVRSVPKFATLSTASSQLYSRGNDTMAHNLEKCVYVCLSFCLQTRHVGGVVFMQNCVCRSRNMSLVKISWNYPGNGRENLNVLLGKRARFLFFEFVFSCCRPSFWVVVLWMVWAAAAAATALHDDSNNNLA